MTVQKNHHIITRTVDSVRGRYFGSLTDEEFDSLMEKNGNELPKGFAVYHIPQEEIDKGSKRVKELSELGLITTFSPFVEGGEAYASPLVQMLRAKNEEVLEANRQLHE